MIATVGVRCALTAAMLALPLACNGRDAADDDTAAAESAAIATAGDARCYRSDASVLLGPSRGGTSEGSPPGWIRLESPGADTGAARLTDSGGAGLHAAWSRTPGDSIHVAGFDDFLRVEMRLVVGDSQLTGTAVATSDADVERDTAGRLQDLRRTWQVTARQAPCDSMPARALDAAR